MTIDTTISLWNNMQTWSLKSQVTGANSLPVHWTIEEKQYRAQSYNCARVISEREQ